MIRGLPQQSPQQDNVKLPWEIVPQGAMPPMMFQMRFHNGAKSSFAYSDLREVHCRDAGFVVLTVQSVSQYLITIEGRNLSGLADWFGAAMIRWIQEGDPRHDPRPESSPEITSISVEVVEE